jgi:hypothetical protein
VGELSVELKSSSSTVGVSQMPLAEVNGLFCVAGADVSFMRIFPIVCSWR